MQRTSDTEIAYWDTGMDLWRQALREVRAAARHGNPDETQSGVPLPAGHPVLEHGYAPFEEGFAIVTEWFCCQHGRWAAATIRRYRSALRHCLRRLQWSGEVDPIEVRKAIAALANGPRPWRGSPRTSARKRMYASEAEVLRVRKVIGGRKGTVGRDTVDRVLEGLLIHLPRLGLRPCEVRTAVLKGRVLKVRGAKATNGRGFAARPQHLTGYTKADVRNLRRLLNRLDVLVADTNGGWNALHRRLAERLARACRRAGVPRLSLYTLRHVAIATQKRTSSRTEVATFAGHRCTRTATRHYGKRRSGWLRPTGVTADPDLCAAVRDNYQAHPSCQASIKASPERRMDLPAMQDCLELTELPACFASQIREAELPKFGK